MIAACGILALAAGLSAAVSTQLRIAIVSLWVCSLAVGGIFLSVGAEYLALVVWLLSTLVATVFVFHTELFGRKERLPNGLVALIAFLLGDAFVVLVWACVQPLKPEQHVGWNSHSPGLLEMGRALVLEHFLPLQVLAIIMLTVVVGLGVISRPETKD